MAHMQPPDRGDGEQRSSVSADEAEWMARVGSGDVEAFERVVERFWSGTLLYAVQISDDFDAAEDVAQEAFVRLWAKRTAWTGTGSVRVWLLRTVRNQVISRHRKREVRRRWAHREAQEDSAPRPKTPLQETERTEVGEAIHDAVRSLSPRRREAFTLFHLQGLSYQEVAEIMVVRPQTVANYLQAALTDLRDVLSPHFPYLAAPDDPTSPSSRPQPRGPVGE